MEGAIEIGLPPLACLRGELLSFIILLVQLYDSSEQQDFIHRPKKSFRHRSRSSAFHPLSRFIHYRFPYSHHSLMKERAFHKNQMICPINMDRATDPCIPPKSKNFISQHYPISSLPTKETKRRATFFQDDTLSMGFLGWIFQLRTIRQYPLFS